MKKNLRAIITYSVIGALCVAALVGFLATNGAPASPAATVNAGVSAAPSAGNAVSSSPGAATASPTPSPTATPIPNKNPLAREDGEEHVKLLMAQAVQMPATHVVGIAQGGDYNAVAKKVMENAGGLKDIIKAGSTVLIKPNLITGDKAGGPIGTDWRVIQAIADIANEYGASRVIVAEASPAGNVYKYSEYDKITGVELFDLNICKKEDCYILKPEKSMTGQELYIPKIYMDADVVIGAAKLKTHFQSDAVVSLGLKLAMGVPPTSLYGSSGGKIILHSMGLKEVIVDLNKIRRPDFMFIDGIVGGEGYGPLSNSPVKSNIMFAGTDIVALDTVALTYMGFTVDEVPHVKLAADEGLGIADLAKITVVGAELDKIKTRFRRAHE